MKKAKGLRKYLGLMFRTRNTEPLVFYFHKPCLSAIHSLFVFFKFAAMWFDENDKVIDCRIIKPFSINVRPSKPFSKLIELPI